MSQLKKLEDSNLWQAASKISEAAESYLGSLPEEEKFAIASRLRHCSFDVTQDISQAVGAIDPRDVKYYFGRVHSNLFALKNTLRVAYRRGYIQLDPQIMVDIDKLTAQIDEELAVIPAKIEAWFEEMEPRDKKDIKKKPSNKKTRSSGRSKP